MSVHTYLFEFKKGGGVTKALEALCKKHNLSIDKEFSMYHSHTNSVVSFKLPSEHDDNFFLSEFPGNCSALVLHHIENRSSAGRLTIVNFCIEVAKCLSYSTLIVSGVSKRDREYFESIGFKVVLERVNFHSGRDNYFAALELEQGNISDAFVKSPVEVEI